MGWMAHRKWKEAKQLPGTAGPGNMLDCNLISFYRADGAIHPIRPVDGDKVSHIVGFKSPLVLLQLPLCDVANLLELVVNLTTVNPLGEVGHEGKE